VFDHFVGKLVVSARVETNRMHARVLPNLYEQLEALPEGLTGEILNGQLHAHPRPAIRHIRVGSSLGGDIYRGFDKGDGGPGGWWILDEPEVHFVRDTEVAVPDIAGWRRERMPVLPDDQRVEVVPDWVCEILSPSTASKDREIKMPLYARYGVAYAWLVDPARQTLEAYALEAGESSALGQYSGRQMISVAPFEAIGIDLADLWRHSVDS
jgi:Uma2 family endonuclease